MTANGRGPVRVKAKQAAGGPRTERRWLLGRQAEIFWAALRLGCTSFGGPVAHLGYFHDEYVKRRRWLDEQTYAGVVALAQALPGPASSQVGISIGLIRGGPWGGALAWLGFTLPSALGLAAFAHVLQGYDAAGAGWLRGLLIAAAAVVAHAVWGMANSLAPDKKRASIAVAAAVGVLLLPTAAAQAVAIVAGGLAGALWLRGGTAKRVSNVRVPMRRTAAVASLLLFASFLLGLPLARLLHPALWLETADSFYRAGSLVFGGGHVVLPLLAAETAGAGRLTEEAFLAGYGAAQAVPGPLFTFAAYLGAAMDGWLLAAVGVIAIFLPSYLLVLGVLPFWEEIRGRPAFHSILAGVNAAVVGILLAALYDPVFTKGVRSPADFALALIAFGLLMFWKAPPWAVVLLCAAGGAGLAALG